MQFDIITLFPEMFSALTDSGITRRAFEEKKCSLSLWNPRDFTQDRHRTVDDRPYGGGGYYKQIKDMEREGDKLTHLILDELGTTFITPFDREDIHDLASSIDDVIDGINSCAKRITIYNPRPISESGKELSRMIRQEADYIVKAMDELETFRKNPNTLRGYCSKMHDIENQADDIYELFITKLFEEEKDCIELIKVKEIVHELEKTTDAAEHVGKILRSLIVKYA